MSHSKIKLSNGLTVITAPLAETKAVTVLVYIPVGSRFEKKDNNGVSHFIEHLMFKGTKRRPSSTDITKELDAVGAEFNAFTGKEYTGYYIKAAAEHIELAFDVLSDMLFASVFDQAEIDKERGVILEEINMYEDNPLMYVDNIFENIVYQDHPLGRLIIGPREVIKNVARKNILTYRDTFYSPRNMFITVAGKCTTSQVGRLSKKYFGQRAATFKKTAFTKFRSKQAAPRVSIMRKDTEQIQLCLGFPAYGLTDKRLAALTLLSVVLGGNMSSRLFVSVREKHGLAYFVKAAAEAYQDTGSFIVQAGLDKKRLHQAISLIMEELKKVCDRGVTNHELATAKDFVRGKLVLGLEDSEAVADWFGKQQMLLGKLETPEQKLKKLDRVTADQIKKVANEVFDDSKINLAVIGPFDSDKQFMPLLRFAK
jgi:predicted Zn-dependent peptidase